MIPVTKPFLPPLEEYQAYVAGIWERNWLTNNGPLSQELEKQLQAFLNNPNAAFCTNGTIALQIAIKALGITGEIITTPFSYVATLNSILWEQCRPVFVDIREDDFCINADLIEKKITDRTQAIMAVHVYGFPCDVDRIGQLAKKYNLKVIYDGAHAFGVQMGGRSLLNHGDITTCSFHATKLFHTIEGGAMVCNDKALFDHLVLLRQFGHIGDDYFTVGINAKNSEFHAAMGLCNLPRVPELIERRKRLSILYDNYLQFDLNFRKPYSQQDFKANFAYYPVYFSTQEQLLQVKEALESNQIFPRRYFFPSFNAMPFVEESQVCPVADSIALRVMALPLFFELEEKMVEHIARIINVAVRL